MTNSRTILRIAVLCVAALVLAATGSASVYSNLVAEFALHENRLPGSDGFEKSLRALKLELESAGLKPEIQTFDTLVPHTEKCVFRVNGVEFGPILPLNNGITPIVTDGAIEGPLVWLGDGSLNAMSGKVVDGCIALLDFDAPRVIVRHAFEHGARAVVFVGGRHASRWSVAGVCCEGPMVIPRFYMSDETFEEAGLKNAEGSLGSIECTVNLRSVTAKNLWVEIPGEEGAVFRLDSEEIAIFSATLDTFGVVPDRCPQSRSAANAALLADVLCRLADKPVKRSIIGVFFGSHYSSQEGARYFYYAAEDGTDGGSLSERREKYAAELDLVNRLADACDRTDVFRGEDEESELLTARIKEKLVGWVNNLNADLRTVRLDRNANEMRLQVTRQDKPVDKSRESVLAHEVESLKAELENILLRRRMWNDLRQAITDKQLDTGDERILDAFREVAGAVKLDLLARRTELEHMLGNNSTFEKIAARFRDKTLIGHFDFDFANDHTPWLFSVIGNTGVMRSGGLDMGSFLMHFAELGKVYDDICRPEWSANLFKAALRPEWDATLFKDALNPYYKPFSLCVPVLRGVPSCVANTVGAPGFELMTVGDSLDGDELPYATECDLHDLSEQMAVFVHAVGNREELSLRQPFKADKIEDRLTYMFEKGDKYTGVRFVNFSKASTEVEGPALDAVASMISGQDGQVGYSSCPFVPVNSDGYIFMPMISRDASRGWNLLGVGFGADGLMNRISTGSTRGVPAGRVGLFYCFGGFLFSRGYGADPVNRDLYEPTILNGRTDGAFKLSCFQRQCVYADRFANFKIIGASGELLLGSTPDDPMGTGIPLDRDVMLNLNGIKQCANDYWLLNESRLGILRERNIVNDALEMLHSEARRHIDQANEVAGENDHAAAQAHNIFATCLENRIYNPLRGVTDDLINAVVVLLLLNIPFAFAMERLIFGFTSIYKQVTGFVLFFVGTFIVLFFTHPAFSLASAPVVVFLAFVMILLSTIAVYVVLGKIRQEIRAIQGLASTVHGVESDSSTALSAVLIGIAGMRNRPLKTALTATTVILLTFTILVFASFTSELGVVDTYVGKGHGEDRIEIHRFSYVDIPSQMIEAIGSLYEEDFTVCKRGGMFMNPTRSHDVGITPLSPDRVIYNPANGKTAGLGAVLGIQKQETERSAMLARLLPGFRDDSLEHTPIYLPEGVVNRLELSLGDEVRMIGRPYSFAGLVNASVLQGITTLDNTKITPPDFESTVKNAGMTAESQKGMQQLEQIDIGSFAWFSPEQIGITDLDFLRQSYPSFTYINFMTLYPSSGEIDIEDIAGEIAEVFQGAVHVKSGDGARKLFFTRAVAGSGFGDVIVPLLLGGLIIFSSLMGSIVDREREIFTYSALGLSPPDVGALFFAESAVYSVVGGMGGYLLSQVVAKVLAFLGSRGFFHPPDMNFSSLSSVLTILIVMGMVMLSTIYPALKAGKAANPGVSRKWKMPAPKGDRLDFVFPFTVSEIDFAGILSFMKEHFDNHADATLGDFAARNVRLFKQPRAEGGDSLGISAEISLAPFDLGIFQKFRMYSQEFEIAGIEEVVVELERIGGTPQSWVRGNRRFADELRRQFLLWRSLPIETVEHYRRQTADTLDVSS